MNNTYFDITKSPTVLTPTEMKERIEWLTNELDSLSRDYLDLEAENHQLNHMLIQYMRKYGVLDTEAAE